MNKIIILIFFSVILISIIYIFKIHSNSNIHFYNRNAPNINVLLENYISHFSQYELDFKTNYQLKNFRSNYDILKFYKSNIIEFTINEKNLITRYIEFINKRFHQYDFITEIDWNFIKLSPHMEKQMPFTLGKYIFLPQSMIDQMKNAINSQNLFIENCDTLIHEKIHVIQRIYPTLFKNFYRNVLNAKLINNLYIGKKWRKVHLKNPDGLNVSWVYILNGIYYLPLLIFNDRDGSLDQIVIKLERYNNKFRTTDKWVDAYNFELFKEYPKFISVYHPNEITAYTIPKILLKNRNINKKIKNKFLILINNHLKNISII